MNLVVIILLLNLLAVDILNSIANLRKSNVSIEIHEIPIPAIQQIVGIQLPSVDSFITNRKKRTNCTSAERIKTLKLVANIPSTTSLPR